MKSVEKLTSPPVVGEKYLVPCVFGKFSNIGPHPIPPAWWPVLKPSHQDTEYMAKFRTIWQEVGDDFVEVDETYYENDPTAPHHFHVDPRFTTDEMYTAWEVDNRSWHTIVEPRSKVEYREMLCVREMPEQRLFTGFGPKFVEDHAGKKLKCGRCPHKGVDLRSMPVVDGVVTCPAHGLKFDCGTKKCVTLQETI